MTQFTLPWLLRAWLDLERATLGRPLPRTLGRQLAAWDMVELRDLWGKAS